MICAYLHCDVEFEPKRPHQLYCCGDHRYAQRVMDRENSGEEPAQRVEGHALDEVRALLEEHKGDWTAIVREHARRTLLATGYLSAPDFDALGVPPEHCNIPGAQLGAFVSAGYMEAITFKRWSAAAKASRKSGKYWIYRITDKGKQMLAGFSDDNKGGGDAVDNAPPTSGNAGTSPPGAPVGVAEPGESGPYQAAAVDAGQIAGKCDQGRVVSSPAAGVDQPDQLFPESAYERKRDAA